MFIFLALASTVLPQDAPASAIPHHCHSEAPGAISPLFDALRPTPIATCDYSLDEVRRRISRLFMNREKAILRVDNLERLLDLPEMTTAYDDPREAEYLMKVFGSEGWQLTIQVREGFFPTNQGEPKFVPGLRPRRLDKFENAVSLVIFDLRLPTMSIEAGSCPVEPFRLAALSSGWKDITNTVVVTDGGIPPPTFKGPNATTVTIEQSSRMPCSSRLMFDREVPSGRTELR